ncbi:pseudouridine-5'-phosphate glycosidase [Clostridia bacterium]|nr:pseudouridine-5'-phosphate glycosidase [Clostridia bacterium]
MYSDITKYFEISPRVKEGLVNSEPVVALESSIISHGMPYPTNLEVAKMAEEVVTENGAIPATIGVWKGKIVVGMDEQQRYEISNKPGDETTVAMKASVKGIPFAVIQKRNAGFTIAAILRAASIAGIRIMATGGIGGVSRGGEFTMDVSADLEELGHTSVGVVAAGCKSILDIGRTKEVLETKDVPVIGLGCDSFPAFFTPSSQYRIDYRIDSYDEAAEFLRTKWELGFQGAAILCNPVPAQYAMDQEIIDEAIRKATEMAKENAVGGEHNTPFLLDRVSELTGGASLRTNIEVIRNNAKTAALIAKSYWNHR